MDSFELLPHQQRVVDEKTELDVKRHALEAFFLTETFKNLEPQDQQHLYDQFAVMSSYSLILTQRIVRF